MSEKTEKELKKEFEKENKLAWKKWKNIPDGLEFDEYYKVSNAIFAKSSKLDREYRLVKTPELKEADDFHLGCQMTFRDFKECCQTGGFIDEYIGAWYNVMSFIMGTLVYLFLDNTAGLGRKSPLF
jgi:hypothetical protein